MPADNNTTIDGKIMTSDELYRQAQQWASRVKTQAKSNASGFTKGKKYAIHIYKKGIYAGKTEKRLKNDVRSVLRRQYGELSRVGFRFPLHGIFVEYGVGRGQPQAAGKKVAKHSYVKRSPNDWIDGPITANEEALGDMVANYYGDQALLNISQRNKIIK